MSKRWIRWAIPISLVAAIKIFSLFPDAVERYYSNGLYRFISAAQRFLFGWIPFSVGDVLYAATVLFLAYSVIIFLKRLFTKKERKKYLFERLQLAIRVLLWIYISFNVLWGLNYNRRGIAHQLEWAKADSAMIVTGEELQSLMQVLALRLNTNDSMARLRRDSLRSDRYLFSEAGKAYGRSVSLFPFLSYRPASVKSSLFGFWGNYLGYTGYYNPFTGEAQVNTAVPLFIQPYTSCHEIGHQLGYAKENEANFAGYLSARSSTNPAFLYSVYFDLYTYGRPYLYFTDSLALRRTDSLLRPGIRADFRELRKFYLAHSNPVEVIIDKAYGQYLKANEQPAGKITYGEVILWLLHYYRNFGPEAI